MDGLDPRTPQRAPVMVEATGFSRGGNLEPNFDPAGCRVSQIEGRRHRRVRRENTEDENERDCEVLKKARDVCLADFHEASGIASTAHSQSQ